MLNVSDDIDFDLDNPAFGDLSLNILALESYVKMLEEQIAFARDQFKIRSEIELKKQQNDDESIWAMSDMADEIFSKFTYNGAVITIWSFFEDISLRFSEYAKDKDKENNKVSVKEFIKKIKKTPELGHNEAIEKYFEETLKIKLPWSTDDRKSLTELRKLRNHIAHENGNVLYLRGNDLEFMQRHCKDSSIMYKSDSFVKDSAELIVRITRELNKTIATKYKQPLFLHDK